MFVIRAVTIAREYGSGGSLIAKELASRLGWKLLDRELVLELAHRAHILPSKVADLDEHPNTFIARLLRSLALGGEIAQPTDIVDPDSIAVLSSLIIEEAAAAGQCVIVGRGAQCVLQDNKDVFHVFVYGSTSEKLKRVRATHAGGQQSEASLNCKDNQRAAYIRSYFHRDWTDRHLYNLMISSDFGIDETVSVISTAAGLGQQLTTIGPAASL